MAKHKAVSLLVEIVEKFESLCKESVDDSYNDIFGRALKKLESVSSGSGCEEFLKWIRTSLKKIEEEKDVTFKRELRYAFLEKLERAVGSK